ncbi:MAG TPA: hypothetical protein VK548_30375 [Candidatus Acidoferrum sp.]|nr:hypothetical protein [Candidatus Acidoferrum sp.]
MWSIARGLAFLALGGLVLGAAAVAAAAPGDLDPTFGTGGTVVTDLGGADYPAAVALQPDGKIVIAGTRLVGPRGTSRFGIVLFRYRSDGTLDATFGTGGFVVTELGDGTIAWVTGVALQSDGKILVTGGAGLISGAFQGFVVARYHSDGTLDATFGSGGLVVTGFGQGHFASAAALALQADGRIVVAGTAYFSPFNQVALARYTANGVLDPTFGVGGTAVLNFDGTQYTRAMALQPDGKIVLTAWTPPFGRQGFLVLRYTADGILDPSFGQGGAAVTDFGGDADPLALGVMADGRIVVAGGARGDLALARYVPDGRPDPSFGAAGKVTTDLGGLEAAYALALQPDGKVVVAGAMAILADRAPDSIGVRDVVFGLARYTPSGELDASFGTGGGQALDFIPSALVLQPDGKIVAVGHLFTDFMVARVIGDSHTVSIANDQAASRPAEVTTTPFVASP